MSKKLKLRLELLHVFHNKAISLLKPFQKYAYDTCIGRKFGCLCLEMGAGKTLISIAVSLKQSIDLLEEKLALKDYSFEIMPVLIVLSKTLVSSWDLEFKKYFKDEIEEHDVCYIVFDKTRYDTIMQEIYASVSFIVVSVDTLSKAYTECNIDKIFCQEEQEKIDDFKGIQVSYYKYIVPHNPLYNSLFPVKKKAYKGLDFLYKHRFMSVIIDEGQEYTNITSIRARAISSLCAVNRWILSGTPINEPKTNIYLGLHMMLNHPTFPRDMYNAEILLSSDTFGGLNSLGTMVKLTDKETKKVGVRKHLMSHLITKEEMIIYTSLKNSIIKNKHLSALAKSSKNTEQTKLFNANCLAIISYIRSCIVNPLIPLAQIMTNLMDIENRSELSLLIFKELKTISDSYGIDMNAYLNDETGKSLISSRIHELMSVIDKHLELYSKGKDEQLLIFTCYPSSIKLIEHILNAKYGKKIEMYRISAKHTTKQRGEIVQQFNEKKTSSMKVFLLTYKLGSEGLNLQSANSVLLLDLWWNDGKTSQAIARAARYGQKRDSVDIYLFTSNTGIENSIFNKHIDKLSIIDELMTGNIKSSVSTIDVNEIVKVIGIEDNESLIKDLMAGKLRARDQ